MLIRAIDFETTGAKEDDATHEIIEIGWCDIVDGVLAPGWQSALRKPAVPISFEAMAVHHITEAMVADATGDVSVLGEPDYFAAHNSDFELSFFTPTKPVICTYKVALRVWPNAKSHSLQYLRYSLGLPASPATVPHRAGPDAHLGALLMARIMADRPDISLDDMVRWSNGPALLTTVTFGKHKGAKWDDLPSDYLEWIINKSDLDRNAKANAKHRLRLRAAMDFVQAAH